MKSIIITGALLMTGAIVYGFADYSSVSRDKDFKSMYEEADLKLQTTLHDVGKTAIVNGMKSNLKKEIPMIIEETPVKTAVKKFKRKRQEIKLKEFSRAALE